jgi:hypothetical protein
MKTRSFLLVVLPLALGFGLVACNGLPTGTLLIGAGGDDDDSIAGGDDDTAGGDDDTAGGDDDTVGDDDDDDDTAGGDDDDDTAGGDDDDVSGEHELTGDYEGEFVMSIDLPGGGDALEEACEGRIWLEVEDDGSYSGVADCESLLWGAPDYEFELEGSVTTSLQFNGVVTGSNSWSGQVDESPSIGYIKVDLIKIEWQGMTPGQGQMARSYAGVGWMELD